ncbi:MFS transporter [Kitasatospora kifunensis]|uniref:MFS family permease n=1 Tax=Kitasatospora kifunensis TaxID=58351 RepID=A0A7W7VYI8_KITKI|nr:MFS transporter [Kitasatospora kifunensis]MBB4927088.1 MFS family permease [Kitasatospora kifunensis]
MTHPLRLRTFRLLFIGRTLSAIGDAVVPTALTLAVTRATGSAAALATVLGCALVPKLLLLPIGGVAADRWDARRVALATDLLRCLCQLSVSLELLGGRPVLSHLAAASMVGGAASAFAMPTRLPLVTGTVDGPARLKANALTASATSLIQLCGPALAGLLIYTVGAGSAFLLDAASFLVSATMLAMIQVRRTPIARRTLRADLIEGWSEVRSRDWYWSSLVAHSVWNGAAAVLATLGPLIAVRRLGGDGAWIAVLEAGAVGLTVGSLLAGRLTPRRPVLIGNLALAGYAIPLLLLALGAPLPLLVAGYAVAMGALGFLNPVWQTAVQQHIPAHVLARVSSYDWLLSLAAMPVGYALAPMAAKAWGASVPLVIAAVLVGGTCLATTAFPGVRRLTTTVAEPTGITAAEAAAEASGAVPTNRTNPTTIGAGTTTGSAAACISASGEHAAAGRP